MPSYPLHITDDAALAPAGAGENGLGATRAAIVWKNEAGDVKVGIWKAEPGRYGAAGRPQAETFIVIDGEADVTVGDAPPRRVMCGSIVHVPAGADIHFVVRHALSKFSALAAP